MRKGKKVPRALMEGGFGSAGAGARTGGQRVGRFRGTRFDHGHRSAAADRDAKINAKSEPVRLADPTREELECAIADGFCWWCGRTHTKTGKEIQAWGTHWAYHGLSLERIRNILLVPRRRTFTSDGLRTERSVRQRALYYADPESRARLRNRGGRRHLTEYGLRVQRAKLAAVHWRGGGSAASVRHAREVQAQRKIAARKPRNCASCGVEFTPRPKGVATRTTCSKACADALKRIALAKNPTRARTQRPCTACGKMFWTRGGRHTCSETCAKAAVRRPRVCRACGKTFWMQTHARTGKPMGTVRRASCSPECEFRLRSTAGKINGAKNRGRRTPPSVRG